MLNFFYYYSYPVGMSDKQLMDFINNARTVEGLAKWIFIASFIPVTAFHRLFWNKDQSILPNP